MIEHCCYCCRSTEPDRLVIIGKATMEDPSVGSVPSTSSAPFLAAFLFNRPSVGNFSFLRNGYKIFVLIFTFFVYTSYHLSRKPISVVKTTLHQNCTAGPNCSSWKPFDGDNADELLGYLDLSYLFAYAVGMFVSGHIAERMNLRYFLFFGMLGSGLFTALFGMGRYWKIHSLWYYIVIQGFCGLIQSTGWPAVVTCVANWFGKGKRGLIMGVWNSHTSVGNILGSLVAGSFVSYNWGLSFIVPGVIIAIMGVLVFLFLVPHPKDVGCENEEYRPIPDQEQCAIQADRETDNFAETDPIIDRDESIDIRPYRSEERAIGFVQALLIPGVIEFSLCLFFAKLVSYTFLFWLPTYITKSTSYDSHKAADLSTLFDVGGIAGGIVAGVVSDYSGGSALTCMVMLVLAAPAMFIYEVYATESLGLNICLLMLCGFLVNGPYSLITTAVSADLGTHESLRGNAKALSTVTAIIDGTGSIGAALGPLLTGFISATGWKNVFYMLIASDIAALLVSSYIYIVYDRSRKTDVKKQMARCNLKPHRIRFTMFHWMVMSFTIFVVVMIVFIFPNS